MAFCSFLFLCRYISFHFNVGQNTNLYCTWRYLSYIAGQNSSERGNASWRYNSAIVSGGVLINICLLWKIYYQNTTVCIVQVYPNQTNNRVSFHICWGYNREEDGCEREEWRLTAARQNTPLWMIVLSSTSTLYEGPLFTHSHTHSYTSGWLLPSKALLSPHWKQFRIQSFAQGHFTHVGSRSRDLNQSSICDWDGQDQAGVTVGVGTASSMCDAYSVFPPFLSHSAFFRFKKKSYGTPPTNNIRKWHCLPKYRQHSVFVSFSSLSVKPGHVYKHTKLISWAVWKEENRLAFLLKHSHLTVEC